MKRLPTLLLACLTASLNVLAASDPVGDYISRFSPLGGDKTVYSSDTLLRLDLDLNGDGQNEVLLSMARDRNAKQGNVWSVYAQAADGYAALGTMTFNSSRFYLGSIDELSRYGLVTFWPGGGGEGTLAGYLLDGATIREVQVAAVTRDAQNGELRGQEVLDKYMSKAVIGDTVTTSIDADTLARQYGIKIDRRTYREVAENLSRSQQAQPIEAPTTQATTNAQAPIIPTAAGSPRAESAAPQGATESHKARWFVVILVIAAVAVIAVYLRSRS